jgi:two-component system, LytTR family, response regulator
VVFLDVADIDWIEAADYYACLHVGNDTHLMRRTLLELERDLGEQKFHPYSPLDHREPARIRGLELQNDGEYEVVLKSKVRLRLSRRFRKRLQDRMGVIWSGGAGIISALILDRLRGAARDDAQCDEVA